MENKIDYNSKTYKRTRSAYLWECMVEYLGTLLITDSFLAKLLSRLGIDDATIGVISSFISLAFIVQLLTIPLNQVKISSKKIVIFFVTISQLLYFSLYIIPFTPISDKVKKQYAMLAILIGYFFIYLVINIYYRWANSFVEPTKRASFSAKKETISLICGMVFILITSYVFNKYENAGNMDKGFVFLAVVMFIIVVINFILYCCIHKEIELPSVTKEKKTYSDIFKNTLGNSQFRKIVVQGALVQMSTYFVVGFVGTLKIKELGLSIFAVQIINISGQCLRAIFSFPLGRYSDKYSFAKGIRLGLFILMIANIFMIFTNKSHWYFIVIYTLLYNLSTGGTSQNAYNITYNFVDINYITEAMSIKYSICGILGFCSSLIAGRIVNFIQANGNMIFGINVLGQQILGIAGTLIALIGIIYTQIVIVPMKRKIQ